MPLISTAAEPCAGQGMAGALPPRCITVGRTVEARATGTGRTICTTTNATAATRITKTPMIRFRPQRDSAWAWRRDFRDMVQTNLRSRRPQGKEPQAEPAPALTWVALPRAPKRRAVSSQLFGRAPLPGIFTKQPWHTTSTTAATISAIS